MSKNDEYILLKLFSKYLFKGSDEVTTTLRNFFLGYCGSDEQAYDVSEPNFLEDKEPKKHIEAIWCNMRHKGEVFLPLMDDWFFKPLLYIHKADDQNLQKLVRNHV